MIELKAVSKKYKNGTHALYDINLKVDEGEFVYVMGPTGSGKSTLVKLLDGEEVPTTGKVIVSGIDVGRLRKSKVYLYRRKIGVVFQDYRLLPEKTVFENIAYALEILDMPTDKIRKRVRDVLKLVDLSDKSNSKPRELSGGQKQRVAIARAVAKKPMIIIADEPTGNLDPGMTDEMITLLERINKEEKTTILVVTHEITTVEKHPKRTIRIEDGHIVSDSIYEPVKKQEEEEKQEEPEIVEEVVENVGEDGIMFMSVDVDEDENIPDVKTPLEAKLLGEDYQEEAEDQIADVNDDTMAEIQAFIQERKNNKPVLERRSDKKNKEVEEKTEQISDFTEDIFEVEEDKQEQKKEIVDASNVLDEAINEMANTVELYNIKNEIDSMENK